jgi:5S rRNA maturation endonuclease (ribonuclease M5)
MKRMERDLLHYTQLYNIFRRLPKHTLVIVEGKTDKEILVQFLIEPGIEIITLKDFRRRMRSMDREQVVFILTDFDKEGEKYARRIRRDLINMGIVNVLDMERKLFRRITRPYGDEIYSIFKSLINKLRLYSYKSLKRLVDARWYGGEITNA